MKTMKTMKTMKKIITSMSLLFTMSIHAYDTKIECRINEGRTDVIELDLEQAIYEKQAIGGNYYNGFSELTQKIEDGDYASVSPEDISITEEYCEDCYLLKISSLSKKYSRYQILAEINFAETAPLQVFLKIKEAYFFSDTEKIKIHCN